MIASLIFVFSLLVLVQFVVSYCRLLLFAYSKVEVSKHVRELASSDPDHFAASDFDSLVQLTRFAPRLDGDANEMRAITAYYRLTQLVSSLVSPVSRAGSRWLNGELSRCTYCAAVALDRRLANLSE